MKSVLTNARISPKKINLIAGMIRGKKAEEALTMLKFTPKKAAQMLYKIISSALANATNNFGQKREDLYIKSIIVNKGITYKRGLAVSRGRYHRILKRNSNVTVEVGLLDTTKQVKTSPGASQSSKKKEKTEDKKKEAPKKEAVKPAKKETKKEST